MGFLKVFEIFRPGLIVFRLDVLALDEQKALHVCHVVRKASECAFHHRDHHRQNSQPDQKREVKFSNVIDVLVLADRPAGNNENKWALHGNKIWSASTSLESFSAPCEATRM